MTRVIEPINDDLVSVARCLVATDNTLFPDDFFSYKFPLPQYLGAKYKHLNWIKCHIPDNIHIVADAFAGSQSVAFFFKQLGFEVYTNDFMNYSNQIGKALVENKASKLSIKDIELLFSENKSSSKFYIMEKLFTDMFFEREEARLLDAFRSNVELLSPTKKSLALAIMNRTLTKKITMGHFAHHQALVYAKNPDRIKRNRSLIRPIKDMFIELVESYNNAIFDNGKNNKSYQSDAIDFVRNLKNVDLLYLDPPYCGSHADYQGFYHLLETFVENWTEKDKNFVNGIKRYEPKLYSGFDTKKDIIGSFEKLFDVAMKIPYWIVSYNDRSFPDKEQMINLLSKYKKVDVSDKEYINGVAGKGSVKGSKELLFICSPK